MQQGTDSFETFRRREGEKMEKEEKDKEKEKEGTGALQWQELRERAAELQREIQLSHQRQEVLSRANQRLTKVIVNNNHQQQQHQLDFINRIQQKNSQVNSEMMRTFISASPNLKLQQNRQAHKHTRMHTDHNEENNFGLSNTNGISPLTQKEVKHRLSKQSALS